MAVQTLHYPFTKVITGGHVLALGYFDGIHRGHQQVLLRTCELAQKSNALPGVLTFHPHPSEVLGKKPICRYITPFQEKVAQFNELGVENVYVIHFDIAFSQVSKEDFVEGIFSVFSVRGIVTGSNFKFGKGASGTTGDLRDLSNGRFAVETVELLEEDEKIISSTRIRSALAEGRIGEVTNILGRTYRIEGTVIPGDQRGRQMGFPTANISCLQPYLLPCHGVYVVRVKIGNTHDLLGIMNIGIRPTISQPHLEERVEIHLFNWDKDIYGETLWIEFLHYLREERKFPSVNELRTQIADDVVRARCWISKFAMV